MPIRVEVVTQEKMLFELDDADMVIVPGSEGVMGILPNHSPVISAMNAGELIVRRGNAEEVFAIYGGFVDIRPDKVLVLADAAEFASEISLQEAEAARERVQAILDQGVPPEDEALVAAQLRQAELAINIARKSQSKAGSVRIRVMKDEEN
jgi:F-type H+-transporting ATPase subunit epsilon